VDQYGSLNQRGMASRNTFLIDPPAKGRKGLDRRQPEQAQRRECWPRWPMLKSSGKEVAAKNVAAKK